MSKNIVLYLQESSVDHSKKTSEVLDLALLVARKLKKDDACDLFSVERSGYGNDKKIERYRLLSGDIIFILNGVEKTVNTKDIIREQLTEVRLSISEIESICEGNKGEFFYLDIKSHEIEKLCREQIVRQLKKPYEYIGSVDKLTSDLIEQSVGDINLKLKIHKLKYARIVSTVRDIIQQWSITLDGLEFDCDHDMFAPEKEVMEFNNYNINNVNGIMGNVVHSNVTQSNFTQSNVTNFKGNDSFLRKSLEENLVPSEDIEEISEILSKSECPANKDSLPIKVNEWIKKMLSKSLDGSWGVSIASAGGVLSQIICRYFGIN